MNESRNLELKETITSTFLKTVSAFSNYDGGTIIFGISDDGEVIGVHNPEQACLDIENRINDSISPQPDYRISVEENETIKLIIENGSNKPYMYKSKAYKRNGTATIEVDTIELTRLILSGSNRNFEELKSNQQSLTFKILEHKLIQEAGIDACDSNVLKTLNLYSDKDGFNIAAEILADKNSFPGIDVCRFGDSISIVKSRKTFENISVLSAYDSVCEIFRDNYKYEIIEGTLRKTVESIPEKAFREAVANAIIHRTWDVPEQIRILMFDDRIEISSPGGLPAGMTAEEYISGDYSKLRNPIISNVFYRLHLVETFGTGVRRIKEEYASSIIKPEFNVYKNSIKVTLPLLQSNTNLKGDKAIVFGTLSMEEGKSMGELATELPFGKSKIRNILNELVSEKIVYISGTGRGVKYHKA